MTGTARDETLMRRALEEARRGLGRTRPNPAVGSVVAQGDEIVGTGWHPRAGTPHAEARALEAAGEKAKGGTLYVNLEPCCYSGRTGACTEAIIAAGVRRVVIGMLDPHPRVDGQGAKALREAGLEVEFGVLEAEAQELNEAFSHFIRTGRPFVSVKSALSLDGRIATASGSSRWITGSAAREAAHEIRDRVDAILVGVETVLADNPRLNVRLGERELAIQRVVLDSSLRTPARSRVLELEDGDPETLLFCAPNPNPSRALDLIDAGAQIVEVPRRGDGLDLEAVLDELGKRELMHLLVEGGSAVVTSVLRQQLAQKAHFFVAPKIIGGDGRAAVGTLGTIDIGTALELSPVRTRTLGTDILIEGYPVYAAQQPPGAETDTGEGDQDPDPPEPYEVTRPAVAVALPGLVVHRP